MSLGESILILGGTFDPIHIGHLIIAEGALNNLGIEKCILIPSSSPPHKDKIHTENNLRLEMVKIAIEGNEGLSVSDIELRREEPSYTLITLNELKDEGLYEELYFLIGADNLTEIKTWYNFDALLEITRFVIVPRSGCEKSFNLIQRVKSGKKIDDIDDEGLSYLIDNIDRIDTLNLPMIDISSTYIRELLYTGKSIKYLVPDGVIDYIYEHNLYSR